MNLISVDHLKNLLDDEDSKISKPVESSGSNRYFDRSRRANDYLRKLFHARKRLRYIQNLYRDGRSRDQGWNVIANPLDENNE